MIYRTLFKGDRIFDKREALIHLRGLWLTRYDNFFFLILLCNKTEGVDSIGEMRHLDFWYAGKPGEHQCGGQGGLVADLFL